MLLAFVNASATAVWPPAGIALAAFLVLGYRVWPGILFGAFLVNLTTTGAVPSSVGIAVGNTLEGVLGAYLVTRFANGRHVFERPPDVFKFAAFAAVISPAVAATVGATFLLSALAIWGTLRGFGPFATQTHNESLLLVQAFIALAAVPSLVLAAAVRDRQRADAHQREIVGRLQQLYGRLEAFERERLLEDERQRIAREAGSAHGDVGHQAVRRPGARAHLPRDRQLVPAH